MCHSGMSRKRFHNLGSNVCMTGKRNHNTIHIDSVGSEDWRLAVKS